MALLNVLLSGGWRLSSTSDLIQKSFSALTPQTTATGSLSTFLQQEVVLGPLVSEFLVSLAYLSSPQVIFLTATDVTRINFAGQSAGLSLASASQITFKDVFLMMNTSGVLPSAIHLGYSGTTSTTVTMLIAG